MNRRVKEFRVAAHAVLRAIDETVPGASTGRVVLEGDVFGAQARAIKPFAKAADATAFFAAFDEEAAEDWWRSLSTRIIEETDRAFLYGTSGRAPVGLLHA